MNRAVRELAMALVLPGVAVALLLSASNPDLRCRLRQNPFQGQGDFTACKSNLKNIGTALEMASTDASGRYPTALGLLTPNYLKTIPTCPSRGSDTYSGGFSSVSNPDAYTVHCTGRNHSWVGAMRDYPEYNSVQGGLMEK